MPAFDISKLKIAAEHTLNAAVVLKYELETRPGGPQVEGLKDAAKWLREAADDVDSAIQD